MFTQPTDNLLPFLILLLLRISGILCVMSVVLSGIPERSALGPLLFTVIINDLGDAHRSSRCLLLPDDIEVFCSVICRNDSTLLQSDIASVRESCADNFLELPL